MCRIQFSLFSRGSRELSLLRSSDSVVGALPAEPSPQPGFIVLFLRAQTTTQWHKACNLALRRLRWDFKFKTILSYKARLYFLKAIFLSRTQNLPRDGEYTCNSSI